MRLILFPYAGGGPAAFSKWSNMFPNHIEIWIAHYPGRGSRFQETPVNKLSLLVEEIYQAIHSLLDMPFAFFGHSLGGLIAFELARALQKNDLAQPNVLFVSSCSAPHFPPPHPPIHALSDVEFTRALQELNGIPEDVGNQPQFMEIFLPALRADIEAAESYHYNPNKQLLSCPIIAFAGMNDPRVSRESLEGWASQTSSKFESTYFPGDHFYLTSAKDELIGSITQEMLNSR